MYSWFSTVDEEMKKKIFQLKIIGLIFLSGTALALHFGFWITSLDLTSLVHSLLFVCSVPLIFVIGMLVLSIKFWRIVESPSWGECVGSIIGFVGLAITVIDTSNIGHGPSISGDMLALLGAFAFILYIVPGTILREWMHLFIYVFPVNLIAVIILQVWSLVQEKTEIFNSDSHRSAVGWIFWPNLGYVLFLGFGAGLFGHTAINYCIKYINPLIVSVVLLLEPVLGSFIGWVFNQTSTPGVFTWLGAPIIIVSTICVSIAAHRRRKISGSKF